MYTAIVKKWFERTNGNTYHSVRIYKGSKLIAEQPFAYGYGSAYEQTAMELMQNAGLFQKTDERMTSGCSVDFHAWNKLLRDDRDFIVFHVSKVTRKKDL